MIHVPYQAGGGGVEPPSTKRFSDLQVYIGIDLIDLLVHGCIDLIDLKVYVCVDLIFRFIIVLI